MIKKFLTPLILIFSVLYVEVASAAPPTANAGTNQTVYNGSLVTLDGSGSVDPESDPLTYSWVQTSGVGVTLSDSSNVNPTFSAPPSATLGFQLTVTAGGESTSDSVVITTIDGVPGIMVKPFMAQANPTGSMSVRLHPTENVATGTPTLVTFGIPFTRGSLTVDDLSTLRIMNGAQEVPAYVEQLTPWRHLVSETLDGGSVRIVRVQIQHTFSTTFPAYEEITVEWGGAQRTASIATLTDPRSAWHLVESGSFVAADGVYEPDVYAVLPKAVLTQGAVRLSRMDPFADSVTEEREDPATIKAVTNWPQYDKLDHISHNQLFTHVNEDDPGVTVSNSCQYKTASEPWLYDRSSTMYVHYLRVCRTEITL